MFSVGSVLENRTTRAGTGGLMTFQRYIRAQGGGGAAWPIWSKCSPASHDSFSRTMISYLDGLESQGRGNIRLEGRRW